MARNTDRLQEAGLIADTERVPEEHRKFLEDLSDDEVKVLIGIKARLDEAGIPVQPLGEPLAAMPVL
jgi:hypothetical protein